jgi:tRNA A37 threonylcarbamoyladenosine synthetase subunit TsaC/SUA5/YrdC
MAVSSANKSGFPPAATAWEARDQLGDAVPVYLDGGASGENVASTIVDLTGPDAVVLREGAVKVEEVSEVLGLEVEVAR